MPPATRLSDPVPTRVAPISRPAHPLALVDTLARPTRAGDTPFAPARATVLVLAGTSPPGASPSALDMADHLAGRGHEILLVDDARHACSLLPVRGNATAEPASLRRRLARSAQSHGPIALLRFGHRLLLSKPAGQQPRADVIVGYFPSVRDSAMIALAAWRQGIPFGLVVNDWPAPSSGRDNWIRRPERIAERWIARRAAGVAIASTASRPKANPWGIPPDRIRRIRSSSTGDAAKRDRSTVRSELGIPDDATLCLVVGDMYRGRGLETVIDAARLGEASEEPLLFALSGDGPQRASLIERARGLANVVFLPPQHGGELANALAVADMLFLSDRAARDDASAAALLGSALASGRPIIASVAPAGEVGMEIRAARAGILVQRDHPAALFSAVRRLAGDPRLAEHLGSNGRAYAARHYSRTAVLDELADFVERLT